MNSRETVDCRQCKSPVSGWVDGVVTGGEEAKGWCNICIGKSLPLMVGIAKLVTEDMEFDDFLEEIAEKRQLRDSGRLAGQVCPVCGNGMIRGSYFSSCRECFPGHFQPCSECGLAKISCVCKWRDYMP